MTHFLIEDNETYSQSACGAYSDRHEYTLYEPYITCPKCLKALDYSEETKS